MRALQGLSKPMDEYNLQMSVTGAITTTPSPSSTITTTTTTTTTTDATADPSQPSTTPDGTQTSSSSPSPSSTPVTSVQATPEQITLYGWRKGLSVKGVPMLLRYPYC